MRLLKSKLSPLFLVTLLDHIAANITFPVLTFIFFSHSSNLFPADTPTAKRALWYGLAIGVAHVGGLISSPVMSTLSDVCGRKKLLFVATMATFFFGVCCAAGVLLGSIFLLFVGKALGGLLTRSNSIALAVVGDVSTDKNKVVNMGYLQLVIAIGAFIGPIVGGYLAQNIAFGLFNYSLPYLVAAVIALIAAACVIFYFKETLNVREKPKALVKDFCLLFKDEKIRRLCLLLFLSQIVWSGYYQYMPPILKTQFHFEPHEVGLFVGLIALWLAIASGFVLPVLKRWFSLRKIAVVSLMLMFLGGLLTVLVVSFSSSVSSLVLWLGAIPMAMGDVILYCAIVSLFSNIVAQEKQGMIMGWCFIIVSITWGSTGLLGGFLGMLHLSLIVYIGFVISSLLFAKQLIWRS